MRHRQGSSEDCEILTEDEHGPAIDLSVTSDDRIAGIGLLVHAEVPTRVLHELIVFGEGAWVAQQLDALASRQLALFRNL